MSRPKGSKNLKPMKTKITSPICSKGHNKNIEGRDTQGKCKRCRNERAKRLYIPKPKKQFCPKDHDTFVVGRYSNYWCKQCQYIYLKNRNKIRIKENIVFKLKLYLRNRINKAILRNSKKGSAVKDLGCSIEFFKQYIQDKFYGNMTWKNWGSVWQLDHIKELHTFDLTDKKQFKQAVYYTNFQPLTIEDHKIKTAGNKGK